MSEAGATAVQEIAFTLANAIAYVQAAVDAGLDVDDFARIQNVVGEKTDVFGNNDESQLDNRELGIVFLDITVKYLQKFGMD